MIGRLGSDFLGSIMRAHYESEGMTPAYIGRSETAGTGAALIEVDAAGENRIVVVKGANDELTAADVQAAQPQFADCDVFLTQLETSIESVTEGMALAHRYGKPVVFNPAPFQQIPPGLLDSVDYLTPNETEAAFFAGVSVETPDDALAAGKILLRRGVRQVIVTLGRRGALYVGRDGDFLLPTVPNQPVDTTGAGDAFNGALCVALAEGMPIRRALMFANTAAAISVTRPGTSPSMPTRAEIDALIGWYDRNNI